jgi:hypothetical protein
MGEKAGAMARPTSASTDLSLSSLPKVPSVPTAVEEVEHQHHGDDDPAGLEDEALEALPGVDQEALEGGQVVGRQFHDEVGAGAGEQGASSQGRR